MAPDFDVVVVGAGPAGASVALHLARLAPAVARRTLLLERAELPRPKPCAGGVTGQGLAVLRRLGLTPPPPLLPLRRVEVAFEGSRWAAEAAGLGITVERARFDAWLAAEAAAAGARLHTGEAVVAVSLGEAGATVATGAGRYTARCLVAADGGASTVLRCLGWPPPAHRARLLYVEDDQPPEATGLSRETLYLDLSPAAAGLHGYLWDFPSPAGGRVGVHRGLYDRGDPGSLRGSLKPLFQAALRARGVDPGRLRLAGYHEREIPARPVVAAPRLLLAGEAAGIDPLFGEGIAQALAHGRLVAREIARAAATG
ncbi:MAG: NAD(P)/FAD-dependent oxidoreductase, partial [Nitrospirae bacterium]